MVCRLGVLAIRNLWPQGGTAVEWWGKAANDDGTFKSRGEPVARCESKGVRPDKKAVAYYSIGKRRSHAWFILKDLQGIAKVRNYDGSWTEWGNLKEAPLEKGEAKAAGAERLSNLQGLSESRKCPPSPRSRHGCFSYFGLSTFDFRPWTVLLASVAWTCSVGPRLLGSNPRVMTGRSSRPIYARCCAEAAVNGTAEHGWERRTADLKNRSALCLLEWQSQCRPRPIPRRMAHRRLLPHGPPRRPKRNGNPLRLPPSEKQEKQ